jgi:predicted nucleic-acid-binding Zn-ribbon protein
MSQKYQCPNCGSYEYKEKSSGGCLYPLATISFFGGAFLSYSLGYMSFLLEMSVLIGLVLSIVFISIQSSLDTKRKKETGQFPAECNQCKYEGVIDLRD